MQRKVDSQTERGDVTFLLFPFVTNTRGFDTSIAISNTTADPFETPEEAGTCTIHYYGSMGGGKPTPEQQESQLVYPGEQLLFVLSTGGNKQVYGTPTFQGYLIVECRFPNAHGFALITDGPIGSARIAGSYLSTRIDARRED